MSTKASTGAKKPQSSPVRKKKAYTQLIGEDERCIIASKKLIECYLRIERKITENRSPRSHWAIEQCCRSLFELYCRMNAERLGYDDLRQNFENMVYLMEYLKTGTPYASATLAAYLKRALCCVEELASKLETVAGSGVTSWDRLRKLLEDEEAALQDGPPPMVLPKMSYITGDAALGAGGFGACFKARLGSGLLCTVKLVKGEMFDTLKYAAVDKVTAATTNHPLLVKYYACFRAFDSHITIMEYIRGTDVERIVEKNKGVPLNIAKYIIAQLGMALQYMHYKGLVHRDIKPSNMMICPGTRVKVIDFDTVKICIGKYGNVRFRSYFRRTWNEYNDRESAGTVCYFPPEAFTCKPYGRTWDWWTVGVTAFAIVYAKVPFRDSQNGDVEVKIRSVSFRFPRKGPRNENCDELKDFVCKLLRKKGEERLCSKKYSEFQAHPLFEGLDWNAVENANHFVDFEIINKQLAKGTTGDYSPIISQQLQQRIVEEGYLRPETTQDITQHFELFTYVSASCLAAIRKIENNEEVTNDVDQVEPPEVGVSDFSYSNKPYTYKFEHLLNK